MCGGQAKFARLLTEISGVGISQQRIWNILNRGQKVPAELALPIERATDGKITRHDLRPDLYPLDEDETGSPASPCALESGAAP